MRINKPRAFWHTLIFVLLVACSQEDESVTSGLNDITSDEFTPGKIATVEVAKDYEVNFWEVRPGDVIVDVYRSIDAEATSQIDLKTVLYNSNYVETYKKLAGKNAGLDAIKKLQQAQLRAKMPLSKMYENNESFLLKTSDDDFSHNIVENERTAAACTADQYNDKYGKQWFLDNFELPNSFPKRFLNSGPLTQTVRTSASTQIVVTVMNGEFCCENVLEIRVRDGVLFYIDLNIGTRKVRSFTIFKRSPVLTFKGALRNGLTCPTSHYLFDAMDAPK